jgi:hypothetical protein
MSEPQTTVIIQRYPDELVKDSHADALIRGLLERSVRRCTSCVPRSCTGATRARNGRR